MHGVAFNVKAVRARCCVSCKASKAVSEMAVISLRKETEGQWNRICRIDLVGGLVNGLVKLVSRGQRVGCRNPCTPWCPQTNEAPVPCADLAQDYCVPTSDLIS